MACSTGAMGLESRGMIAVQVLELKGNGMQYKG